MTTALTKTTQLKDLLSKQEYKIRFSEILGQRAPQFAAAIVQIANSSLALQNCDPNSLIAAALTAAILDLPIDKNLGFAHIVPYSGLAQFQMGYKGFIQLAIRSGQYKLLNSCEVRKGELVAFNRLKGELILDPVKKESDEVVGYAAYFMLNNGYEHAVYWTDDEVKAHAAKYSQAYKNNKKDSPWFTKFDAMAKKTVIKDLISHWGIMSIQMQTAIVEDQGIHRAIDTEVEYIDNDHSPEGMVRGATAKAPTMTGGAPFVSSPAAAPTPVETITPAATPTTVPATPAESPVTGKDALYDADKPLDSIQSMMNRDGLTAHQVVAYAQSIGLASKTVKKVNEIRTTNIQKLCETWANHLDKIKTFPVGE